MTKKTYLLFLSITIYLFLINGCAWNNEQELYPSSTNCNNPSSLSYSKDIVPILESKCTSCHSNSFPAANISLEGYNNVKKQVDNQRLLGTIRHEKNYSPMPQGEPKMNICTIEKIEKWIASGAPNN